MNPLVEIEKTERDIKDLEFRLSSFKDGVLGIDREIALQTIKEVALLENIKNLKKSNIIVVASEFRRSRDSLKITQNRLEMIRKDKQNLEDALGKVVDLLVKAKAKLSDLKELQGTNVLVGNFGSRDVK